MDGQDENGKQVENVGLTFYVLVLCFTKPLKNYCLLSSRKFTLYLPFAIPGVILLREKVVNHILAHSLLICYAMSSPKEKNIYFINESHSTSTSSRPFSPAHQPWLHHPR